MVVHSEARKQRHGPERWRNWIGMERARNAITTIKHSARQIYGLIWILLVPILHGPWRLRPSQPKILAKDAAETVKGWPAPIDEYQRYRFNNLAYRSIRFEPEASEKHVSVVGPARHLPLLLQYGEWRLLNLSASKLQPVEP